MTETFPLKKGKIPKGLKKVKINVYYDKVQGCYWQKKGNTLHKLKDVA